LSSEPEPYTFLTVDKTQKNVNDVDYPSISFQFQLSSKVNTYERTVYSAFSLISDAGGFNGAIVIFPSLFMAIYSGRMFNSSLLEEVPVRKTRKRNKSTVTVEDKLESGIEIQELTSEDI